MVITKDMLQHILDETPEEMDIEEVFNKISLSVKIEQALLESKKD